MQLKRNLKSSYSKGEISTAKTIISDIKLLTRPLVALNKENQNAFLTILIGENNQFGFYDLANNIEEKINLYLNTSTIDKKVNSTHIKTKITDEIAVLGKNLSDALRNPEVGALFGGNVNVLLAASAFYPSLDFMTLLDKGEKVSISNLEDLKNSITLKESQFKGFGYLAVSPPTSSTAYSYINETFNNSPFLLYCLNANSASSWSKYTNGRSIPTAIGWGLLLLAIGIHPVYKLHHRTNRKEFIETDLFKDLFPTWDTSFSEELWNNFGSGDLKPYVQPKTRSFYNPNHASLRLKLEASIVAWYTKGKQLTNYPTAQKLIDTLNQKYLALSRNLSLWRDINEIILSLSRNKVFPQTDTKLYIAAYSIDYTFDKDLHLKVFKLSSVASFIHFDANPNPNTYTMLRYLADGKTGDVRKISFLTGISTESWIRYEQSNRVANNAAWTIALFCFDLHPVYRVEKRTEPSEIKLAYTVYKQLHQTTTPKTEEFHLHESMDFNDFQKIIK